MLRAVQLPPLHTDTKFTAPDVQRKPYTKPQIVHELQLETQAGPGSVNSAGPNSLPMRNPFDPRPNQ